MRYYVLAEMRFTDRAWVRSYVEQVTPMVERYGGRYLARTTRPERLEGDGDPPPLTVLTEWPSREAAMAFYESDEYRPFRDRRLAGSEARMLLVPGEDVTGAARIE